MAVFTCNFCDCYFPCVYISEDNGYLPTECTRKFQDMTEMGLEAKWEKLTTEEYIELLGEFLNESKKDIDLSMKAKKERVVLGVLPDEEHQVDRLVAFIECECGEQMTISAMEIVRFGMENDGESFTDECSCGRKFTWETSSVRHVWKGLEFLFKVTEVPE